MGPVVDRIGRRCWCWIVQLPLPEKTQGEVEVEMPVLLKSASKLGLRIARVFGEAVPTALLEVDVSATVLVVAAAGGLVVAGAMTILDVEAAEVLITTEIKGVDVISTGRVLVDTAAWVLLELADGRVSVGFAKEDVLTGVVTVGD